MPAALIDLNGGSAKLEASLKRPEKAFFFYKYNTADDRELWFDVHDNWKLWSVVHGGWRPLRGFHNSWSLLRDEPDRWSGNTDR